MKTALLLLCLLPAVLTHAQTGKRAVNDTTCFPRAFMQPGQCKNRQLGDLLVGFALDSTGTVVTCVLLLATQPVGVCTLTATNNSYQFNVKLGNSYSNGYITLNLEASGGASTLTGNFLYSVEANNTRFTFQGALTAWYVRAINP
ncbi:hypothetical protein EGT74_25575 [Chitinophaga lutea]|uniref:Uncharacterized protein n=1 Tax=Chitinophaga lutea TaxID=2488634 RepID=A0A3N4PN44_9BACT|nr:hypothetical protein [Chitinophaga lutea]RPE05737.1 hypothetical protein EGT74_25575 [Chitinophaga lutea]